jgi:hypothetical protein
VSPSSSSLSAQGAVADRRAGGQCRCRQGRCRIGFQRRQQGGGDRCRHPQTPLLAQRVFDVLLGDQVQVGKNVAQPLAGLALQFNRAGQLFFGNQLLFDQQLTQHRFILVAR